MRQNDRVGQISDVYLAFRPSPALPLDYPVWFPLCRLSVYRAESPRCHTATYGVPLSKAYEMDCQRRSGDPPWVTLQSLNKGQAPCPQFIEKAADVRRMATAAR